MANTKQAKVINDYLLDFLRSLPATGPNGFEGLIRVLLEKWTRLTFRLARSGSQFGKDGTAETHGPFSVTFETKRYKETTELNARELSGELLQVKTAFPSLDLWVLAATKEVGDLAEDLRKSAIQLDVDILVVDARADGIGPLQVLCAEYPQVIADFCQRNNKSSVVKSIARHIENIKKSAHFPSAVERLRKSLTTTVFGTASARIDSYNWLKKQITNKKEAYAAFSQDIGLLEIGSRRILRSSINHSLDSWWNSCKAYSSVCALMGEEGAGKTWALFSWLVEKFDDASGPIVLPITTAQLSVCTDLIEIIATALHQRCGRVQDFWLKRIESWQQRPRSDEPLFLLCLDGLNERPDFPWRKILAQASSDKLLGQIAIIVTCRSEIWRKNISTGVKEVIIETLGYDDAELQQALEASDLKLSQIPPALQPLIRKPRYCDLVAQHFTAMVKSGDMTVERLLYEDCKDKERRKLNQPVSDEDFRAILCSLAKQYYDGIATISKNTLKQYLPSADATGTMLQEIIDGGLLIHSGSIEPTYKVDPRRLIHGLGMLLADHLNNNSTETSVSALADVIRAWLEPQPDMDMKASVVGAAVFFSLVEQNYKANSRRALLLFWINIRNMSDEQEENICAYLPECAEDMATIADVCWRTSHDNGMAHTRLAHAFLKRRDDGRVKPALIRAVNRWMSYVNIKGQRFERGSDDKHLPEISEAINKRFGCNLVPGNDANFLEWSFPITDDDGLLRLARFALLIISGGDRLSFIEAFVRWAVSRRLMGRDAELDEAAWTLRLSDEELWLHLGPILTQMVKSEDDTLRKAAHLLASCLGCKEAYALRTAQLAGLYPPSEWHIEHEKDPLASTLGTISRDQCVPCMQRDDLALHQIERKIERYILDPAIDAPQNFIDRLSDAAIYLPVQGFNASFSHSIEDHSIEQMEPFLARFAPHDYCNMLRRAISTLPTRDEEGKRQLLIHLPDIALVLQTAEIEILTKILSEYWDNSAKWEGAESGGLIEREIFAESMGFLALSTSLSAEELAETILSRPNHARDLLRLQHWFDVLPGNDVCDFLNRLLIETDNHKLIRMLWVLASSKPQLSGPHCEVLKKLLESSDDKLRGITYRFIWATQDTDLIDYVLNQKRSLLSPENLWADAWYFEIFNRFGNERPFDELLTSLRLPELARMLHRRGCIKEEVAQFVVLLNGIWQRIAKQNRVETSVFPPIEVNSSSDCGVNFSQQSLPSESTSRRFVSSDSCWGSGTLATTNDFDGAFTVETDKQYSDRHRAINNKLKELAEKEETSWWSLELPIELLRCICRDYPEIAKEWVDAALNSKSILVSCEGFYQFLCAALVDVDPIMGFSLWDRLRTGRSNIHFRDETNCDLMTRLPFLASPSRETEGIRNNMLDACVSDADLIEFATVAVSCNCGKWLMGQVEVLLQSPILWRRAKGLMLACLSDLDIDFEKLISESAVSGTWVESTFDSLRGLYSRNRWARYWYERFLTVDDEDDAYSAYVVFLKSTDRRCLLWMDSLDEGSQIKNKRIKFRATNYQQIERAINKNEKDHIDHFMTLKFQKGQLLPFI